MYSRAAAVTGCCAATDVTQWHRAVILKDTTYAHPVQKFPVLYGPKIFITMFITVCLPLVYILRQMNPVHNPPPHFLAILLSSHLYLGHSSNLFPSGFPVTLHMNFSSLPMHATSPSSSSSLVSQSQYCSSRSTKCQIYCFKF